MAYRLVLQVFEWAAVAAATGFAILAYIDWTPAGLVGVALILLGALCVRGLALSAVRGEQVDGVLRLMRNAAPGKADNDEGGGR